MIDFTSMIGKKILWAGSDTNEDMESSAYVLLEDGTCYAIDGDGNSTILKDGMDTLEQVVNANIQKAKSIMQLDAVLKTLKAPTPKAVVPAELKRGASEAVPGDAPKF